MTYRAFLEAKIKLESGSGFDCFPEEVNPILKPHQRDIVCWAVRGGRRAIFAAFGLGKSVIQLEIVRLVLAKAGGGCGLIVMPLGVRQEFKRDAAMLGTTVIFIRTNAEISGPSIYLTNYESVRDGKLDPSAFIVVSLDEAAILRGFGGTKTFREFMAVLAGDRKTMNQRTRSAGVRYRFVATATPSPNEYIELLSYSAFLDVMDVSGAKTRFFKRDSTKADELTLHPHKAREFWLWVASWAIFVQRPSDLGYPDDGYELPALEVRWHEIASDHSTAGADRDGQGRMFRNAALGVTDAAREKRDSLVQRVAKTIELVLNGQTGTREATQRPKEKDAAIPEFAQVIVWCDLNDEQRALESALTEAGISFSSLYGSQPIERREQLLSEWRDRRTTVFLSKTSMYGAGVNLQQCHRMIFAGVHFKFFEVIQGVHRIHRYLQEHACTVYLIYTEAEREVRRSLETKWAQHDRMVAQMTAIIREYGLSRAAMAAALKRGMGCERAEVAGRGWTLINNDSVEELPRLAENSVGLILTSIPFSTQYEYSPNYADFGHTDNNEHFFGQMDFLTPQLLRVLQPGRMAAIHVKDRIVPGGLTGLGFQTVYPFHAKCIEHYTRHGFAYMGMKTIVTDVVRENNQTYRLGWTEQCKDGTKMGVGMPEYLLLFRKPPTESVNSYADLPVLKEKARYTRSRWQIDAHGFSRSSGNRLIGPEDLRGLRHDQIFKLFREWSQTHVYDFEHHVALGEAMEREGTLPVTFMLLQPQSWSEDVWTDITRMLTLNGAQSAKGKEMHLCLARGSLVLTRDGYVPIEEIASNDEVLTHLGRWRKVLATRMTGAAREVIDLRAQGVAGLRLTPDHKLWTRRADGARAVDAATKAEPTWVAAEDTVGHYVNLKLPPVEPSALTPRECWLVGRWLADGHVGTRGDYWVSVGRDKLAEFERLAGDHAGTRSEGTAIQVRLKGLSDTVRAALSRCGRGAGGKLVPAEVFSLPADLAQSVLGGYLSGDGHLTSSRGRWMASSVSRALLSGIALLVQRVHGTSASIGPGRPAGEAVIQGRAVKTRQEWVLSFQDSSAESRKQPFILEDGAWKRVRSAEPAGVSEVWCLKVEDDQSFTVEGCVVKNCPMQFDLADRIINQLSMKGETVLDPFSGLGTVPQRSVLLGRRGLGIELSRAYFTDAVFYCQAAERELATPSLFDLCEPIEVAA